MNDKPLNLDTFCPTSREHWRAWLEENHDQKQSVWVLYHKKKSARPTLSYSDAVDEALCFGWIDSTSRPIDEHTYMQFFCRRKPNSGWSKVNKAKVQRLIADGLMMKAGFASLETARQNGSWTLLDEVEELIIPADLDAAFTEKPAARSYFLSLSKSDKRAILQWLVLAKRPETRQNRITEIAEQAKQNQKPKALQWTRKRTLL